jgi:hypothetical protein
MAYDKLDGTGTKSVVQRDAANAKCVASLRGVEAEDELKQLDHKFKLDKSSNEMQVYIASDLHLHADDPFRAIGAVYSTASALKL